MGDGEEEVKQEKKGRHSLLLFILLSPSPRIVV